MRNLKLKQVLPVDTEIETLQEFQGAASPHIQSKAAGLDTTTNTPGLHSVKETPGLHVMGDLFDVRATSVF